ncbi:MAG: xanthine dehydrogenase family protein subunit M [Proteobacteria bacterium]|nr:xanthine dehydrogenase family protein subunit M [Pseudomonadota bacterium]
MYPFKYHRPTSLEEAASLYNGSDDPVYLSGGMTLIPTMKQRLAAPADVIDLSGIESLTGISVKGDKLTIGAFTTHAAVMASADVRKHIPVLAYLAAQIGDAQVRNRGTIGGSVANSDPSADYPAAIVSLGTTIHCQNRSIDGTEFFKDLFETALEPGEIITSIEFSMPTRAAYRKFPNPASRYAVVGVLVADFGGSIRVGVTGAGPCACRASGMEKVLNDNLKPAAIDAVEVPDAGFNSDLHASAEYRAHLVKVMAKRAVAAMLEG